MPLPFGNHPVLSVSPHAQSDLISESLGDECSRNVNSRPKRRRRQIKGESRGLKGVGLPERGGEERAARESSLTICNGPSADGPADPE